MDTGCDRQENPGGSGVGTKDSREPNNPWPTPENTLTLVRDCSTGTHTFGSIWLEDGREIQTLELPWRENRQGISCIPSGIYPCRANVARQLIHIDNVPGREGIQLHVGNYLKDTHGCILPGMWRIAPGPIKTTPAVMDSLNALNLLLRHLRGRKLIAGTFFLEIKSCSSQTAEMLQS